MRIAAIELYQLDLEVVGDPFRMARTSVETLDTTILRLITEGGISGWGETCPIGPVYQPHHALGARAALAEMAPALLGLDPLSIGPFHTAMDERLNGHDYAKAAVDMALWDLAGKHYGARICDLLGGARRERVPSYYALSIAEPGEMARVADDKVRQGYNRLQVKAGGRPLEADIESVHAIWDQIGTRARLVVDANRGWNTRDLIQFSTLCTAIPLVLEQPCDTVEEIVASRQQLRHPVYLDESADGVPAVLRAISAGLCDGFALKLTRVGGPTNMRTLRDICAARSMPHTCDDAWGGDIVAAACVHVAATVVDGCLEGSWIAAPYIDGHYDRGGGIEVRDGFIDVPSGPGLGLDIDACAFGTPIAVYGLG